MVEWGGSFGIYFVITDISRFYLPLYSTGDLRWLHLSLHGER